MSVVLRRLLLVFLLAAFAGLAVLGASLEGPRAKAPSFGYVPDPRFSRLLFPGERGLGASIVWSSAILYFADVVLDGEDPRFLGDLLRTVNVLDPDWVYPYEFGGLVLCGRDGRPDPAALRILEDGIARHPNEWRLRIYLVNDLQAGNFGLSEAALADSCARVLLPLSTGRIACPPFARTLAFTLLRKGGRPEEAMRKLTELYETIQDPLLQLRFREKMQELLVPCLPALGTTPREFSQLLGAMLDADPNERSQAKALLVALADERTRASALPVARNLLRQFRAFAASPR